MFFQMINPPEGWQDDDHHYSYLASIKIILRVVYKIRAHKLFNSVGAIPGGLRAS